MTGALVISPPFNVLPPKLQQRHHHSEGRPTFVLNLLEPWENHHLQTKKSPSISRYKSSSLNNKEECDVYGCIELNNDDDNKNNASFNQTVNRRNVTIIASSPLPMSRQLRRQGRRLRRRLQRALEYFIPGNQETSETDNFHPPYNSATEKLFDFMDNDRDGFLTETELLSAGYGLTSKDLGAMDVNQDGRLSKAELREAVVASYARAGRQDIADEIDDVLGELEPLERQEMRLEGFEPYILVSVLTAEGSFGMISEMNNLKWDCVDDTMANGEHFGEIIMAFDWLSMALLFSAGISTVMGIYATTVFSLCILYGKTALGMSRDAEYYKFMDVTGMQRYRAFQAFSWALLTFSTSVLLLVTLRSPPPFRQPLAALSLAALFFGVQEYETIVKAARPIFIPSSKRRDS
jgi:Ca2+-binding EF-hand superfamily protein